VVFLLFVFFFFFQAEDGIRDFHVTGVQTCALPISSSSCCWPAASRSRWAPRRSRSCSRSSSRTRPVSAAARSSAASPASPCWARSEERRVGKEGSLRWAACGQEEREERRVSGRQVV